MLTVNSQISGDSAMSNAQLTLQDVLEVVRSPLMLPATSLVRDLQGAAAKEGFLFTEPFSSACFRRDIMLETMSDRLTQEYNGDFLQQPGLTIVTGHDDDENFDLRELAVVYNGRVSEASFKGGAKTDRQAYYFSLYVLADLDINILQLQDGQIGFNSYAQELKWLLTDPIRIDHISQIISGLSTGGNTLVLIDRIKTGEMLMERNSDWVFISGEMKTSDRQKEYAEVSEMNNKVIVATYGVAAVGINIPRIFNLVMIEPGKSFVRVIQSIGRGIRKAEDKDYVQVVDLTSNLKYSKRHLTHRKTYYKEQNFRNQMTKVEYK